MTAIFEGAKLAGSAATTYFTYKTSEKGETVIVTVPLDDYTAPVQDRAAGELETLPPPCARDVVLENCSAVARMMIDYGTLRQRIRAAKGD